MMVSCQAEEGEAAVNAKSTHARLAEATRAMAVIERELERLFVVILRTKDANDRDRLRAEWRRLISRMSEIALAADDAEDHPNLKVVSATRP
jgi:hypothetical protein